MLEMGLGELGWRESGPVVTVCLDGMIGLSVGEIGEAVDGGGWKGDDWRRSRADCW